MYNAFHGVDVSTHQKRQVIFFKKKFIPEYDWYLFEPCNMCVVCQ